MPLRDAARHVVGIKPLLTQEVRDTKGTAAVGTEDDDGAIAWKIALLVRHAVHRNVVRIRNMHLVPFILLAYVKQ